MESNSYWSYGTNNLFKILAALHSLLGTDLGLHYTWGLDKTCYYAINTESAEYISRLDGLMEYTDLVLLDVKHIDEEKHKVLTGHSNKRVLAFAKYLEKKNIPLWARHVVVEGYTDGEDELYRLGIFLGTLKNLKALDVLPYHTLGVKKYEELGLPYPLEGTEPTSAEKKNAAKEHILRGIRDGRAARANKNLL